MYEWKPKPWIIHRIVFYFPWYFASNKQFFYDTKKYINFNWTNIDNSKNEWKDGWIQHSIQYQCYETVSPNWAVHKGSYRMCTCDILVRRLVWVSHLHKPAERRAKNVWCETAEKKLNSFIALNVSKCLLWFLYASEYCVWNSQIVLFQCILKLRIFLRIQI